MFRRIVAVAAVDKVEAGSVHRAKDVVAGVAEQFVFAVVSGDGIVTRAAAEGVGAEQVCENALSFAPSNSVSDRPANVP